MDNTTKELIALYDKWISIVESQLSLLCEERQDENFDQLRVWEVEKRNTKLMVMEYNTAYDRLDMAAKERLKGAFQRLITLNEQAEPYLKAWYNDAARDMKQVTTQQRIITSYGGVQSSDIISLYVDSKK